VQASATDTITLAVDEQGTAQVSANAGDAVVQSGGLRIAIGSGQSVPVQAAAVGATAASRLHALDGPRPRVVETAVLRDADVVVSVPVTVEPAPVDHQERPKDVPAKHLPEPVLPPPPSLDAGIAHDAPAAENATERWRSARLFRSQGKFNEAIAECVAIADSGDRTWAPIALIEAARIELGPLTAPERAITYVDRFEREWPGNGLDPEARDLRCRALIQLGRGAECAPTK
jgi:hypothetical protein